MKLLPMVLTVTACVNPPPANCSPAFPGEWTYSDADDDGYGRENGKEEWTCEPVPGRVHDHTDCDDEASNVNPGAVDIPRDGVDQDCDGKDAISDEDGDGFFADDCDDLDPAVHPDAEDVWYDGVDSNCDRADDFDQDGDRFPVERDCDDTQAAISPGAVEVWGDGVDSDCFAGDLPAFHDAGYSWVDVRNVVVVKNEVHWLIITAAESTDATPVSNVGVGLAFGWTGDSEVFDTITWFVPADLSEVLGRRVDADSGPLGVYVAAAYSDHSPERHTWLRQKRIVWDPFRQEYRLDGHDMFQRVTDISVDVDVGALINGDRYAAACGAQSAVFMSSTAETARRDYGCVNSGYLNACSAGPPTPPVPTSCFVEPSGAETTASTMTLCDATTCGTYSLIDEAMTLAASQPYATRTWRTQEAHGDWVVRTSADGVAYFGPDGSGTALAGLDILDAEINANEGRVFLAAVVPDQDGDGLHDVALAWGLPGEALHEAVIPAASATGVVDVRSAALATDGADTLVAVSGIGVNGDAVAWSWVQLP